MASTALVADLGNFYQYFDDEMLICFVLKYVTWFGLCLRHLTQLGEVADIQCVTLCVRNLLVEVFETRHIAFSWKEGTE